MGKKYIIELEEKPFHKDNGDFLYRVKGFNSLVFDMNGIQKLTPCTEPDLDAIRKEAYEDGFKNAVHNCPEGCPYVEHARNGAYQRGYEQGYKDGYNEPGKGKIQVGDEIKSVSGKAVVTGLSPDNEHVRYVYFDGSTGVIHKSGVSRTGRHFPEIEEVLAKMKESE